MQRELGGEEEGMSTTIEPFEEPEGYSGGGSTDAADVSWLVPTASVNVACWPLHTPGHSWGVTASVGASPGFTGMLTAAKVLAGAAIDCLVDPALVEEARKEFKENTRDFVYKSAIPKDQQPRKGAVTVQEE
jgi:aminobenzoyl-glutamate utilization protein B